ncbi:unnamed protein product [Parnassius apollo]|uniref:(apollo) hypothetical protein n=1 Tax=Parnassius apollo TaxID=110799 RepID=A0A8S3WH45_PARAO|nr:unnamed protein product [Parnassius apollo]
MKLIYFFAVMTFITIVKGAVDVEKTVQQVQNILKSNSLLPRLTRDEILQLLNDIRAEDTKGNLSPKDHKSTVGKKTVNTNQEKKLNSLIQESDIRANKQQDITLSSPTTTTTSVETTTSNGLKITVVLPYTTRDGSSLQELYTKPPRVEIIPEPKVTKKPLTTLKLKENDQKTSSNNNNKKIIDSNTPVFPAELQAFLDAHGLKGEPGQDNFLLPLDGFKPLPAAKVIDESVQLPENILLAYDLISPADTKTPATKNKIVSQNTFLYEPLPPKYPFELDTSSSEIKDTVLPLDLPKPRKTKSATPKPNYEPIDYDSVRVIPLNKGPSPIDDEKIIFDTELNKRQTIETTSITNLSNDMNTTEETTTIANEFKNAAVAADNDTGASISDLEESFGGAAPAEPGDSVLPPPRKNGFYWMLDWNSFLEVGDGDTKVNIRFEPKLGDPQMFLPVNVP